MLENHANERQIITNMEALDVPEATHEKNEAALTVHI